MRIPLLDLHAQHQVLRTEIALALSDVLERQDFILGREVTALEEAIAALCGRRFAVACGSGTDALVLALMALGAGPGDRVLVPAFTFFATASCVARVGAQPVFADIEPATFNLDPRRLPGQARFVIPVDLFGQIAPFEQIPPAAGVVVEDAAQSILAERHGRRAGSFGVISTLSFYPTKNLSAAGDAGMALTDDQELAGRMRRLRAHGARESYYHQEIGLNSRMDTLQAAILLVKLKRLARWTEQGIAAAAVYDRLFRESGLAPERVITPLTGAGNRHVYHQYTIRVPGGRRDAVREALREAGVASGLYYPVPLHLQPCFAYLGGKPGDLPESERAAAEVLSLPMFPELEAAQQERVVEVVGAALR
jgi:dTDP-4-amino-4,6-dideoxygalactose transaminase